jgi:hypothetical protein
MNNVSFIIVLQKIKFHNITSYNKIQMKQRLVSLILD